MLNVAKLHEAEVQNLELIYTPKKKKKNGGFVLSFDTILA